MRQAEPMLPSLGAKSLNQWITREVLYAHYLDCGGDWTDVDIYPKVSNCIL